MNRVIITGRLTKNPEGRTTQSGISQSTFDVAVQRRFKNRDGQYEADFLTVVAWRQTAEYCNKYLLKGRMVAVEGSIQTRSYEAKDGGKRYVTEIIADNVEALDSPKNADAPKREEAPTMPEGFTEVEDDEELPFD